MRGFSLGGAPILFAAPKSVYLASRLPAVPMTNGYGFKWA
jgi:hypothetical protein